MAMATYSVSLDRTLNAKASARARQLGYTDESGEAIIEDYLRHLLRNDLGED